MPVGVAASLLPSFIPRGPPEPTSALTQGLSSPRTLDGPFTLVSGETTRGGYNPEQLMEQHLGAVCLGMGYDEIIT